MANPPVNFQALVQAPKGGAGGDYPYAIKARDLMKNFVFATLDLDIDLYEETPIGEHVQRKLKIKAGTIANQLLFWDGYEYTPFEPPPASGTWVLGSIDGTIAWIETESCDAEPE
jgi:hypothetical protein